MRLDRIFITYTLKAFFNILIIMLPILYLSDFLFHAEFSPTDALIKIPYRFGQVQGGVLLWSTWLGIRAMRKKYTDMAFISMGFRPKDAWRSMIIISVMFMLIDTCILIPYNQLFFDEKIKITNWSVKKIYNPEAHSYTKFFFHKHKTTDIIEIWGEHEPAKLNFVTLKQDQPFKFHTQEIRLKNDDFYILWNESNKLSWTGLTRCSNYLKRHELDNTAPIVQLHIFASRVLILAAMVICAFALAWQEGVWAMLVCCIASSWLMQVSIFMPIFYAILCIWINVIIWIGFGLWFLL